MSLQGIAADPNSGLDAQQPSGFDESSPKNVSDSEADSSRELSYINTIKTKPTRRLSAC